MATCFPVPVLLYWLLLFCKQNKEARWPAEIDEECEGKVDVAQAIYDGLARGFRESKHGTQHWEGVLMFRRLLISATILIPNSQIQLCLCLALCLVFLNHHSSQRPFVHGVSNRSETFSLSLLCGVAAINLFKTAELNPEGPQVAILNCLELMEGMFVVLLIFFIVCMETAKK